MYRVQRAKRVGRMANPAAPIGTEGGAERRREAQPLAGADGCAFLQATAAAHPTVNTITRRVIDSPRFYIPWANDSVGKNKGGDTTTSTELIAFVRGIESHDQLCRLRVTALRVDCRGNNQSRSKPSATRHMCIYGPSDACTETVPLALLDYYQDLLSFSPTRYDEPDPADRMRRPLVGTILAAGSSMVKARAFSVPSVAFAYSCVSSVSARCAEPTQASGVGLPLSSSAASDRDKR